MKFQGTWHGGIVSLAGGQRLEIPERILGDTKKGVSGPCVSCYSVREVFLLDISKNTAKVLGKYVCDVSFGGR